MAIEDFTTYTEVDPNNRLTVTSTKASSDDATGDEDVYLYKDFGVDNFNDIGFRFTLYVASTSVGEAYAGISVANTIGSYLDLESTAISCQVGKINDTTYRLFLRRGQETPDGYYTISADTPYYCVLSREADSDTVTLKVYSDEERANLLHTFNGTGYGTATKYRYVYGFNHRNASGSHKFDGYVESLYLSCTPAVTTQAVTNISETTATGNGNITDLGFPNPTAHGVVWDTSTIDTGLDPTAQPNYTDEGAASATGAFTSSMTGLTEGTKYYVRAYATNSEGTSYGAETTFRAGIPIGSELSGVISVVETRFHYVDAYGNERYIEGTLV